MIPKIDFLAKLKLNDFVMGFLTAISLLYPSLIGFYLYDPEVLVTHNTFIVLLLSASFGMVTMAGTAWNTFEAFQQAFAANKISVDSLKRIMPTILLYQLITFSLYFCAFSLIFKVIQYKASGTISYDSTFIAFIIGFIGFNSLFMKFVRRNNAKRLVGLDKPEVKDGNNDKVIDAQ